MGRTAVLSIVLLAAAAVRADSFRWINAAGGTYADAANWAPLGPPGAADDAVFDAPATYTVAFNADAACANFNVYAGQVWLDLDGHALEASDYVVIAAAPGGDARLFPLPGTFTAAYVSLYGGEGLAELRASGAGTVVQAGELYLDGPTLAIAELGGEFRAVNFSAYGDEFGPAEIFVVGEHSAATVSERFHVTKNAYVTIHAGASATAEILSVWDGDFRADDPNTTVIVGNDVSVLALTGNAEARLGLFAGARLEAAEMWIARFDPNAITATASVGAGASLDIAGRLLISDRGGLFVENARAECGSLDAFVGQLSVFDPGGSMTVHGALTAIGGPGGLSPITVEDGGQITAATTYARGANVFVDGALFSTAGAFVAQTDPNGVTNVFIRGGGVLEADSISLDGAGPGGGTLCSLEGRDAEIRAAATLTADPFTQIYVENGPGIIAAPQFDLDGTLLVFDRARVEGNLTNRGQVYVAGPGSRVLDLVGDYRQELNGRLDFAIYGPSSYGALRATGNLHFLGGSVIIQPAGYQPVKGDVFDLLDFASAENLGATLFLGALSPGLEWDASDLFVTGELRVVGEGTCFGDINGDGVVSLADLTTMLANFGTVGSATPEQGDLDGDMDVDIADLANLLSVFGTTCE